VRDGHHEGKGRRATDAKDKKRQLHMTGQQKRNRCGTTFVCAQSADDAHKDLMAHLSGQ
jgi:hypothetical protein